jgi:uncharacterized protein YjbI with pentapeptide repeats
MNLLPQSRNLQRRSFRGKNLCGANFSRFNLSGADFTDAILDGADFSHADLRGTIFRRSSLIGANLSYSRSGVPIDRELFLQVILLVLAVLLGLLAGFVGSSVIGLLTDESQVFQPYHEIKFPISWHTVSGLLAISYSIIFGFIIFLKSPVTAVMLGVGSIILIDTIIVGSIIYACQQTGQPSEVVGYMAIAVGGSAMLIIFQGVFTTVCLAIVVGIVNRNKHVLLATIAGALIALNSVIHVKSSGYIQLGTIVGSGVIIYTSFQVGNRNRSNQQKYYAIDTIATYFSTFYGTCFERSNLTDANLEYALLSNANLSRANLQHTNFYGVRQLDLARIDRTILTNPVVRDLLVTHWGSFGNYKNCDLHGAYLVKADLRNTDFTGADLSNVDLRQAQLDHANLSRILAANTNFQGAILTGACIADWSIDSSTQLADITCDYIYLKSPQKDRSPASGTFRAGDFTRLFQEIWNTVDLIFQHGIDWTSFSNSWQQIQIENEGIPLTIHSIERKGEGLIVVKVEVPVGLDKAKLYQEFNLAYDLLLQSAKDHHQAELAGRDREIAVYQSQQVQLNHVLQSLLTPAPIKTPPEQLVTIKLGRRDINHNLAVTVEIGDRGISPRAAAVGTLPCENEITAAYGDWQLAYRDQLDRTCRIDVPEQQITNLNKLNLSHACQIQSAYLSQKINQWLDCIEFRPIKDLMLKELQPNRSIQIILQTDDLQIRQLPFQLWNLFDHFPLAELAIASNIYRASYPANISSKQSIQGENLQVLAIFGDRQGIDLNPDYHALTDLAAATVELLIAPTRQILTDKLWEQPWDVIFFAGHSGSHPNLSTGYLKINPADKLTISELKYAIQQSIASGLKLMIINSCDGLGLANELISMQIAQVIVMREPIPDFVAQQFLKSFLTAFASGKSLYLAVRSAREQLQGLEDKYPCASWLPVICQNPAEIIR